MEGIEIFDLAQGGQFRTIPDISGQLIERGCEKKCGERIGKWSGETFALAFELLFEKGFAGNLAVGGVEHHEDADGGGNHADDAPDDDLSVPLSFLVPVVLQLVRAAVSVVECLCMDGAWARELEDAGGEQDKNAA